MTNMDTSDSESLSANASIPIVLSGLVGSGKSGFATVLQREFPEFCRCNQDEMGKRTDVEREANSVLSQSLSVCIDRVNFDPSQRRTWIDIGRQCPGVEIWCLEMDTPYKTCHARVLKRKDHPTLKTPEQAVRASEGFNRVFRIPPHNNPDYTRKDIEKVLAAARESPCFPSPDSLPPVQPSNNSQGRGSWGRGSSSRGYRGHGTPNSHSWRSRHTSSTGVLGAESVPLHQDEDNWRTQAPIETGAPRGRG